MFKDQEVDMHIHSNFTDGRNSVKELVAIGKEKSIKGMVLTDHDTFKGVPDFMRLCQKNGIDCLTGIEISSTFPCYDQSLDILGYGVNSKEFEAKYSDLLIHNIETRRKWAAQVLDLYRKNGIINFSLKKLQKHFNLPAKVSNKYWILAARVEQMKRLGLTTPGGPINFARNELKEGGCFYVARGDYVSTQEVIQKIGECGGLAVWAHPSKTFEKLRKTGHLSGVFEYLLIVLNSYGLDGVEINTPYLRDDRQLSKFIKGCAKRHGIKIFTGGSDYHGEHGINENCHIGCSGVSYEDFLKIKNLCLKME